MSHTAIMLCAGIALLLFGVPVAIVLATRRFAANRRD